MENTKDLSNKVMVVTGANSGIGYEASLAFARRGATVVLVCRNPRRGEEAVRRIREASGNAGVHLLVADFSKMASVSRCADELLQKFPRINVLCNNAGAANAKRQLTEDGFELTFAANHLAGFLLTMKLLPALLAAAVAGEARVVFTSSYGHNNSPLDFADLNLEQGYGGLKAYGRSKLMNLLTARELHHRFHQQGIVSSSFHPGAVRTPIWGKGGAIGRVLGLALYPFMISSVKGADTMIWLAASEEAAARGANGGYFYQRRPGAVAAFATDAAAAKLWEESERLLRSFLEK